MANEWPPKWPWQPGHLGPPADPKTAWTVYNNTLFFNIAISVRDMWLKDVEAYVVKGFSRWESYYGSRHAGPFNNNCFSTSFKWSCSGYN